MSSMSSQGVVLVTAMAVSGTVILLALRLQKSLPNNTDFQVQTQILRSCISSEPKKKKKNSKRVRFADDVVEPRGDGQEFRRQHCNSSISPSSCSNENKSKNNNKSNNNKKVKEMPANRVALYNGILKGRLVHRVAYSC